MLEFILNEIQSEGIRALEYADESIRRAERAERLGDVITAKSFMERAYSYKSIANSQAHVYSLTIHGAYSLGVVNVWNDMRRGLNSQELMQLCGIGFAREDVS